MKKIYLDVAGRMHSLYRELVENPPDGYEFIASTTLWDRSSRAASKADFVYLFQKNFLRKVVPVSLIKPYLERWKRLPRGTSLTYSAGHLIFRKEPWVVDLEFVTQLTGYTITHFKRYRGLIEKTLASEYCKKIICWTEAGKRTVLQNMNCDGYKHKVETVPLAVRKKDFIKDYSHEGKVKLLFIGSANILEEFEQRGGKETLEAFTILHQRYPNLELVIRSDVPKEIKTKYKGLGNLTIIDEIIPWEQFEQEFKSADIVLYPGHGSPGLAILDAMSYELPVITNDVWANPEMVDDGTTGFVIKKSERVPYYIENFIPAGRSPDYMKAYRTIVDPKVVEQLVEKTSILIENSDLRREMGKAGREGVEKGKFSIESRNKKLKRIFDEAIAGTSGE